MKTAILCASMLVGECSKPSEPRAESAAAPKPKASKSPTTRPLDSIMEAYLTIQRALKSDSLEGVNEAAHTLAQAKVAADDPTAPLVAAITRAAAPLKGAPVAKAREAFKALSSVMFHYRASKPGLRSKTKVAHCPMAEAAWIQTGDVIANPYYGSQMLECGAFVTGPTWADVKPLTEAHCARCHGPNPQTDTPKRSKRAREAMKHVDMSTFPFGGDHADVPGQIVEVMTIGKDGKITMPEDQAGLIPNADTEAIIAWARAGAPAADGTKPTWGAGKAKKKHHGQH